MENWKVYTLSELCDFNQESYSAKDSWEFINYLDTGNITENRINEIYHLNHLVDKIPSRAKRKVKTNDILFSTVRPNQKHYGIIKEKIPNLLVSTGFTVISTKNNNILDSDFLYYHITQPHIIYQLHGIAEQNTSAYPSIKPSDIEDIKLLLPPIKIQKAIAKILNYINEKIRVNYEINKNLEEIGKNIFDEWFFKYEPFHENEFKSSEIPVEWEIDYLGSNKLSEIISSGINEFEGNKFYVATRNVNEDKIDNVLPIISYNNRPSRANMQPVPKSAWFAKMKDSRKLIMVDEYSESILDNTIFSTGFCGLKCSELSFYYIWSFLLSDQFDTMKNNLTLGTTMQAINNTNVKKIKLLKPTNKVLKKFNLIVSPIFEEIYNNKLENMKLSKLRDILLPKLMSGEIDVSGVEI